MADTSFLRNQVEEYVRSELSREFGVPFRPDMVELVIGGTHEFDAVSPDLRIVAAIKTAGGKTRNKKNPSGKIKDVEAELYYLTLVPAEVRLLVVTSREFLLLGGCTTVMTVSAQHEVCLHLREVLARGPGERQGSAGCCGGCCGCEEAAGFCGEGGVHGQQPDEGFPPRDLPLGGGNLSGEPSGFQVPL